MAEATLKKKMNGKLLAKNTLYNLIGQVAPIIVAFFAIPFLIKGMGTERFGLLTIVWIIIGYFGFLDFGIARALIQLIAEKIGEDKQEELPSLVRTALLLLFIIGIIGAIILYAITPWLLDDVLKVSSHFRDETYTAMLYVALGIPIVISSTAVRGILEAFQRFDLVNYIRIPLGIFNYLGPLVVLAFSTKLSSIVLVLIIGRLIFWFLNTLLCIPVMPNLFKSFTCKLKDMKPLISFGGWMAISNMASPLMGYLDRFIIGYLLSVSLVAFYTTPYEMVTKLIIIPGALVTSLFPTFGLFYKTDLSRVKNYYYKGLSWTFISLFPFILIIIAFAKEGLGIWIDANFASHSYLILQVLALGVLLNGIGYMPFALIQGVGRPDIPAKVNFIELFLYILIIFFFINWFGIIGAALAWTTRMFFDTLFLLLFAKRLLKDGKVTYQIKSGYMIILSMSIFVFFLDMPLFLKIGVFLLFGLAFLYLSWFKFLSEEDRSQFKRKIKSFV